MRTTFILEIDNTIIETVHSNSIAMQINESATIGDSVRIYPFNYHDEHNTKLHGTVQQYHDIDLRFTKRTLDISDTWNGQVHTTITIALESTI